MPSTIAALAGCIAEQADQLRKLAAASGRHELREYARLVASFATDCQCIALDGDTPRGGYGEGCADTETLPSRTLDQTLRFSIP